MSTEGFSGLDDIDFGNTLRGHRVGDRLFGRFALGRELGRGGMGVVWLAKDELLGRDVVLKFLPEVVRFDTTAVEELKEETRKGLDLAHPNIVKVYDFNLDDKHAAISMEFVDGDTMAKLRAMQPIKVFEPAEIQEWVAQLISGLHYAHSTARIVHRDLKPSNLIINKAGVLKIMDFGIARSIADSMFRTTMRETSTGTLPYMSPQQALGKPVSISDDIYSFGCTHYELMTGKPPFFTGNVMEQVRSVKPTSVAERRMEFGVTGQPVPEAWEATLQSCLAKEPAARPRDMKEIARNLGLLESADLGGYTPSVTSDTTRARAAAEAAAQPPTGPSTAEIVAAVSSIEPPPAPVEEETPPALPGEPTQADTLNSNPTGPVTQNTGALGTLGQTASGQTVSTSGGRLAASVAAPLVSRKLSATGPLSTPAATAKKPAMATGRKPAAEPRPATGQRKKGNPMMAIGIVLGVLLFLFLGVCGIGFYAYKTYIEPKMLAAKQALEDPANADPILLQGVITGLATNGKLEEAKPLLTAYVAKNGADDFAQAMALQLGVTLATEPPPTTTTDPIASTDKPPAKTDPPLGVAEKPPVKETPPVKESPPVVKETPPVAPTSDRPEPLMVPDKFPTIQAAITSSKPGDTIAIKPGYYEEILTLKSGITLEPAGEGSVVIRAAGKTGSVLTIDGVKNSTVRGLIFEHSGDEDSEEVRWAVVQIKSSYVVLDSCQIRRGMGSGLSISGPGGSQIRKCIIERNAWYGVMLERGADATLEGCTSQQNGGPGVFIAHIGTKPTLRGSTITRNLHSGLVIEEEGQAILEGNTFELNVEMGVSLIGDGVVATMKANKLNDNKMDGLSVQDGARVILVENEIKGNKRNGVLIYDAADGSEVIGNQIIGNTLDGLILAISPNGTGKYQKMVVSRNTSTGHSINGVQLIGAGVTPVLEGNTVFSNGQGDITSTGGAKPVLKDNKVGGAGGGGTPQTSVPPTQVVPTPTPTPPPAVQQPPATQPALNAKNSGGNVPVLNPDGAGADDDSAMRALPKGTPPPAPAPAPTTSTYPPPVNAAPTPSAPAPAPTPAAPAPAMPSKNAGNVPVMNPEAGME